MKYRVAKGRTKRNVYEKDFRTKSEAKEFLSHARRIAPGRKFRIIKI